MVPIRVDGRAGNQLLCRRTDASGDGIGGLDVQRPRCLQCPRCRRRFGCSRPGVPVRLGGTLALSESYRAARGDGRCFSAPLSADAWRFRPNTSSTRLANFPAPCPLSSSSPTSRRTIWTLSFMIRSTSLGPIYGPTRTTWSVGIGKGGQGASRRRTKKMNIERPTSNIEC
jgi:hypothetical protein